MKFLLDTHILLWSLMDTPELSKKVRDKVIDEKNIIFVSAVSVWEIVIKQTIGKIIIPNDLENVLYKSNFTPLPIEISHTLAVGKLPLIHADPFDRLLIAQSKVEGLTLITKDKNIMRYEGISFFWE